MSRPSGPHSRRIECLVNVSPAISGVSLHVNAPGTRARVISPWPVKICEIAGHAFHRVHLTYDTDGACIRRDQAFLDSFRTRKPRVQVGGIVDLLHVLRKMNMRVLGYIRRSGTGREKNRRAETRRRTRLILISVKINRANPSFCPLASSRDLAAQFDYPVALDASHSNNRANYRACGEYR